MTFTGVLRSWQDDRGFGFIAPTQGGPEVFVHIGAFSRDGSRPTVGERLSYELAPGRDGKPQAVNVTRSAVGVARPAAALRSDTGRSGSSVFGTLLAVLLMVVLAAWAYKHFSATMQRKTLANQPASRPAEPAPRTVEPMAGGYTCDGRTHCSQMSSCAEATWFINHCPGTKMDGNGDGVPCEQQWCTAGAAR